MTLESDVDTIYRNPGWFPVKHGLCETPEYPIWEHIKNRCSCPSNARYGGRGIKVCERWLNDVSAFIADMGPRPSLAHSIDRIDNDGDYEPGNCRWATATEQARNRRSSKLYSYNGESKTLTAWSEVSGVLSGTIWFRVKAGWSLGEAIFTPARGKRHA